MKILLIEDNPGDALLMRERLATAADVAHEIETVARLSVGIEHLRKNGADLIIVDLHLPDSDGMDTLRQVCAAAPDAAIIVMTGLDDEELALRAVRKGAQDYLVKGQVDDRTLRRAIRYAIERHQTLAVLRHQARMQALGQLTAGVAHEFNNLLAAIVGSAEMLQQRLKSDDALGRVADRIVQASHRGAKLTYSLLAFCGMQPLVPKAVSLTEALSDLEAIAHGTLGEKISLNLDVPDNTWLAMADAGQLRIALTHILMNSRDAMPMGGTIHISVGNLRIDEGCPRTKRVVPGEYVSMTVRDNGTGMSPETLERAFEPFFTTKGVGQGTGLGLSMVYGFARQSGGDIELASDVGVGTTATLFLPANSEALGSRASIARDAA